MNDVRTFRAATMQEALDHVRRELGSDAVILHTRQVSRRRFLPWKRPEQHVEITAGIGANVGSPAARSRGRKPQPGAANSRPASRTQAKGKPKVPPAAGAVASTPGVTFDRTTTDADVARILAAARTQPAAAKVNSRPAAAVPAVTSTPAASGIPTEFSSRLDTIQQMLEQLGRSRPKGRDDEIPPELFQLFTNLIDAEVDEDIAREMILRLKESASPDAIGNHQAALATLTAMVEKEIACSGPIVTSPGQRKVVALVGSTGVGKTTTIAKLAANFRLRDGVKMGLVTVDTYRIAAVEQLRTYAEIIDLPMKVVTSPPEMRRALDELAGLDLVLIDTAGRSPRDELKIQELKSLLGEASVDEVHLVMNLTASPKMLQSTAERFAAAGTTSLILTKLDEATGMGSLLSVARQIPLPVSYLTTGQDVPDDIEPANATRMARLVLGRENLVD